MRRALAQPAPHRPQPRALLGASRVDAEALARALRTETTSEVRFDNVSRALYATDASVYKLRPLGVASSSRSVFLPDVPTMKEAGVADFVADNWYGVLVPTGTPKPVIDRLQREIAKAVVQQDAKDRFFGAGLESRPSKTPLEFGAFVENDVARWATVIKQANIKME